MRDQMFKVEWPTLLLIVATYAVWGVALFWISSWSVAVATVIAALAIVQHASLQHEVLHGHPLPWQCLNEFLVRPSLNLVIPYGRFRDTHLAHHKDSNLTDPYDDPETNFMAGCDWVKVPRLAKWILASNNTLAGRMLIGPLIAQWAFMRGDIRNINPSIARSWAAHIIVSIGVVWVVLHSSMPFWAYALSAYLALSCLKIRTFLEHRAHELSRARSVIVEDRGPLAFLFLNNNLHAVHHMHPQVAWFDLPGLYGANKDRFLSCNEGYLYKSYRTVFARHLLKAKDPVAHPLWHKEEEKLDA